MSRIEPSLSILIPTAGNGDLPHVLHSISTQATIPGDDVVIVGDGPQPYVRAAIEAIVDTKTFPCSIRYLESQRTNDFGHTQLNEAMAEARGDYVMVQDDDDIFLPRAFEVIRHRLGEGVCPSCSGYGGDSGGPGSWTCAKCGGTGGTKEGPHIFRFYTNDHWLVWNPEDNHRIEETLIGSHNLVVPSDRLANPGDRRLGRFTPRYRGDFDWTKSTLAFYPETQWKWHTEIITRQRPNRAVLDWPIDGRETGAAFPNIPLPISGVWGWKFTDREIPNSPAIGHAVVWKDKNNALFFDFSLAPEAVGRGFLRWIAQHTIDACQGDAYFGGETSPQKDAILEELGVRRGHLVWP